VSKTKQTKQVFLVNYFITIQGDYGPSWKSPGVSFGQIRDKLEHQSIDINLDTKSSSNLISRKASFSKDNLGNTVIEIPKKLWQGKDFGSLKIHLSQDILNNLTLHQDDCEYTSC
jgi:hypothetical protein